MDLYLVRHAAAHERDPERWPDDDRRPLTPEGEKKFRSAARGLSRTVSGVEAMLSSPLERAWRTAEILAELDFWPAPIRCPELEPEVPPEGTALALKDYAGAGSIAVVGHRPGLHELASYLLTGRTDGVGILLKKGGVICIGFDAPFEPGAGELRWLVTPEMLRG